MGCPHRIELCNSDMPYYFPTAHGDTVPDEFQQNRAEETEGIPCQLGVKQALLRERLPPQQGSQGVRRLTTLTDHEGRQAQIYCRIAVERPPS